VAHRDLIVIGASAGGIEALQQLIGLLPVDLDAAVLVVLHTSSHSGSLLPQIFQRATRLPVSHPRDKTRIRNGHIYIAPPDFHMVVEGDLLRIIQGPRENLHRPAIDPLFRSAATSFGNRVIGVILTGLLDDGTSGLMVVHARGGKAIIQDPKTALFSSMPASALRQVPDAHVVPLAGIPDLLVRSTREELPEGSGNGPHDLMAEKETRFAELDMSEVENERHLGRPSAFACPDCGGVLWEMEENGFLRFRCRVGHAYTARNLGAEQRHAIEAALWAALRALEENASLYRRMASRAANAQHDTTAEKFKERAENTLTNAQTLREFLLRVNQEEEDLLTFEDTR
jgi:two-component system chemotaxis response regulator CheB